MRLIDADALIKSMKSHTVEDNGLTNDYKAGLTDSIRTAVALAENASTIDAVPVVRCGDCKYGTWLESCQRRRCDYWTCFRNGMVYGRANTVNENDYCSHGAKMESEGGT